MPPRTPAAKDCTCSVDTVSALVSMAKLGKHATEADQGSRRHELHLILPPGRLWMLRHAAFTYSPVDGDGGGLTVH